VPDHNSTKIFGAKFWQHGDVSAQRFIYRGRHVLDHSSTKIFGAKFSQHGDVSAQCFIYRGTTVGMDICDINRAIATENQNSDGRLPSSTCC
jgi:hypothetical protein